MKFVELAPYQIPGFELRILTPEDNLQMRAVREAVMAVLPDPVWYFSMQDWEIDEWLSQQSAVGYFCGDVLAGFAVCTPWHQRGDHAYALVLGDPAEDTYDFHDVMVRPEYRGHRMHQHFLKVGTASVRALGGKAMYCTVDPGNSASWHNFEKEGYECVLTQPAYDGRMRRYYRLKV